MSYPYNYNYEMPPMSNTRINYCPDYPYNSPPPLPYVAEAHRPPSHNYPSASNNLNPCRILSPIISIMLAIVSTFYAIVLFAQYSKLPCKTQMTPFLSLGAISSIGLALISLLSLVYFANFCQKGTKIIIYIISVISFCGSIGFLIFVWLMRNRHIGICYMRNNFSPILITMGFIQAALSILVPLTLNFI